MIVIDQAHLSFVLAKKMPWKGEHPGQERGTALESLGRRVRTSSLGFIARSRERRMPATLQQLPSKSGFRCRISTRHGFS